MVNFIAENLLFVIDCFLISPIIDKISPILLVKLLSWVFDLEIDLTIKHVGGIKQKIIGDIKKISVKSQK